MTTSLSLAIEKAFQLVPFINLVRGYGGRVLDDSLKLQWPENHDWFEKPIEWYFTACQNQRANNEHYCPPNSIVQDVCMYLTDLRLDAETPQRQALIYAAILVENSFVMRPPAYHNRGHFSDVLFFAARFIKQNRDMQGQAGTVTLTSGNEILLLLSALIHDFGHQGKRNPQSDPLYNEQRSFKLAKAGLEITDLPQRDMKIIECLLLGTSPDGARQAIECLCLADIFGNASYGIESIIDQVDPENLLSDPEIRLMAGMLADADIAGSAGISLDVTRRFSRQVLLEMSGNREPNKKSIESAIEYFLTKFMREDGFCSLPARALLQGNFKIMRKAMKERSLG